MKKSIALFLLSVAAAFSQGMISGAGNLGCSGTVSSFAAVNSGTSTGVFGTIATNTPAPLFAVQLDQTTTLTGGVVTVQITYDGTNWITTPANQISSGSGGPISNPYTLVASTNQSFLVVMSGASGLRLNLTTAITGTGAVTAYYYAVCGLGVAPNAVYNSTLPTLANGQATILQVDTKGQQYVDLNYLAGAALGAPSNYGTSPGAVAVQGVNADVTNTVATVGTPSTSSTNAATVYRAAALTTTATAKSSAGNLYGWYIYNPNSSLCSLDIFNTTSPTLGTTAPILSLVIPATSGANLAPGSIAVSNFSTAIANAAVTAAGGATTCSTGMTVNLFYN